jgi:hypothetical protein
LPNPSSEHEHTNAGVRKGGGREGNAPNSTTTTHTQRLSSAIPSARHDRLYCTCDAALWLGVADSEEAVDDRGEPPSDAGDGVRAAGDTAFDGESLRGEHEAEGEAESGEALRVRVRAEGELELAAEAAAEAEAGESGTGVGASSA